MTAEDTRHETIGLGCFAVASVLLFSAAYTHALWHVAPNQSIRPMTMWLLFCAVLGMGGWIPCVILGIRQLFVRPRVYGLISIGVGLVQVMGYQAAHWLILGSRGLYWGS